MSDQEEISSSNTEEKISLSQAAKGARKYGTVGPSMMKTQYNSNYVQHKVQPGDTLQGIALRYGSSMEFIKRTNKLWNNDMLYLREILYVPIAADQTGENSPSNIKPLENSISSSLSTSGSTTDEMTASTEERSFSDMLSDIDTRIEQAKLMAKNLQENSQVMKTSDFEINDAPQTRSRNFNRGRHSFPDVHARYISSSGDGDAPTIVILPNSRSSLNSSVQRLERSHDEIFEL